MKIEDFKALNPSARRPVILAAGTPHILLPWDNAFVFQRNFNAYSQGQYASWTAWTAPSTMNSAEAARHTGMSEIDLRSMNNIPPRMLIKAGSTLLVPRSSANAENDVSSHVADNAQVSLAPEIVTRRTMVKARKGESVVSIASRYGVSAASVAAWNSVSAQSAFKKGHAVVLFLPLRAYAATSAHSTARAMGRVHINATPRATVTATKRSSTPIKRSSDKTIVKIRKR